MVQIASYYPSVGYYLHILKKIANLDQYSMNNTPLQWCLLYITVVNTAGLAGPDAIISQHLKTDLGVFKLENSNTTHLHYTSRWHRCKHDIVNTNLADLEEVWDAYPFWGVFWPQCSHKQAVFRIAKVVECANLVPKERKINPLHNTDKWTTSYKSLECTQTII